MKSEFKARPVYLQREDRIRAHFLTCFIALMIYRVLEKKLEYKYTSSQITTTLAEMNFLKIEGDGYIPSYTKTEITDSLHLFAGFKTDYQIVPTKKMKKNIAMTKK